MSDFERWLASYHNANTFAEIHAAILQWGAGPRVTPEELEQINQAVDAAYLRARTGPSGDHRQP